MSDEKIPYWKNKYPLLVRDKAMYKDYIERIEAKIRNKESVIRDIREDIEITIEEKKHYEEKRANYIYELLDTYT